MIRINEIKISINSSFDKVKSKISKILKTNISNIDKITIIRKSVDTRDKKNILYVYNVAVTTKNIDEVKIVSKINNKLVSIYQKKEFNPCVIKKPYFINKNIVIVGSGPSGLFAAYIFALNGFKPIILERGDKVENRKNKILDFVNRDILDENSNISFGEGGAGTFSDGKLYTRVDNGSEISYYLMNLLIKFGADEDILYDYEPHIGTDCLSKVIINLRKEIEKLGGKFINNYFWYPTDKTYGIKNDNIILLAIGNSSRDTFFELQKYGFNLKQKGFAIGYRVIHRADLINLAIYGDKNLSKKLGNASYHLKYTDRTINKTAYSFCMCPGGYVVNSSNFKNYISINGMSFSDRDNVYSNSAIVVNIETNDFKDKKNPLAGVELQKEIENSFYEIGKGKIPYCKLADFIETTNNSDVSVEKMFYTKSIYYKNLRSVLDNKIKTFNFNKVFLDAMNYFDNIIDGFANYETIVAGIESRTSSPISLDRDENYESNIKNVYPIGEGLGHGGGIVSCAIDGMKVALKIIERYKHG